MTSPNSDHGADASVTVTAVRDVSKGRTAWVWSERFMEVGEPRSEGQDPWAPQRIGIIRDAIAGASLPLQMVEPREATEDELLMVHTQKYVDVIREYSSGDELRGDDFRYVNADTTITSNTYELASLAAGAVFTGIDVVMEQRARNAVLLLRPGDHHAYPERGEGFCIFNHTALGARYAQRQYGLERVMIIDWDLHHGNGTQAIFYSDPSVFTFSSHAYGAIYPRTGHETERGAGTARGTTLNVPFPAGTRDRTYLAAFSKALRSVRFKPDLVLLVAGFDGHEEDPMHGLRLSDAAFPVLTREVMEFAERTCGGRLVSVLAGGYNLDTVGRLMSGHVTDLAC